MDGWMGRWLGRRMDGGVDGWIGRWMGRWTDEWMEGEGWMGRRVDGWGDGWVDGWMDGWVESLAQVAQRSCGCPIPGGGSRAGWRGLGATCSGGRCPWVEPDGLEGPFPASPFSGSKVEQLKLYEMLISQARQPLLRHKPVLTPLLRLLSLCAEPTSPPLENSLVLLLNQLCVSVAKEPAVLELFFHSPADQGPANLIIFSLLIPFIHHEGVLGQQARDALLLIMAMSASNHAVAKSITDNSYFCPVWPGVTRGRVPPLSPGAPSTGSRLAPGAGARAVPGGTSWSREERGLGDGLGTRGTVPWGHWGDVGASKGPWL
uniref:Uncharacterized protein n=1 Tax=Calidris pygmaea TaxID=425635 RepID=A0A8C3KIV2_9CHAR